ncbi:MAG: lipoate--protein ligase family protein [Candidatus Thorarchaeota archaeon]|nr:MAG: lipoate--protein ligase family protein [Candidatus Thorarchaeota archaeon]
MDTTWRVVISEETDPTWNLAVDEAILRSVIDDNSPNTVRIWRSSESVIIGRSQDTRAEVDIRLCNELSIPILRRCSGGGTVYMDLGNYNYSVIANSSVFTQVKAVHHIARFMCMAVVNLLSRLDCDSRFVPPSSVFIEDSKVSGSAQYFLYEGILHHGTLLVNADLELMQEVLAPNPTLAKRLRSVPSVSTPVVNLSSLFGKQYQFEEIANLLVDAIMGTLGAHNWDLGPTSTSENELTQLLYDTKYSDPCWLLGVQRQKQITIDSTALPTNRIQ